MMRIRLVLIMAGVQAAAQVPFDRIVKSAAEPQNWLTYSGNYQAHRYSALNQITAANVHRLRTAWVYQTHEQGSTETSPIGVDGVLYITEPPTIVTALDARTGRRLWTYERILPKDLRTIGFGRVNRGVAVLGDSVFVGTLDAHLVALDRRSGAVRWDVEVADYHLGHCITVAPLAIKDKVITGISGGEAGVRGFIDAYDAATGKRAWRFWTIPGPGERGHDTWSGDAWKTGGGTTWVTGSYDPELNLVYWGTGNPGPDWNGDSRPGDNLYTCSVVALDADKGTLRWHFQFTPHDDHDWDATEIPVLVDAVVRGRPRKLLAMANRNAFYYLLDRVSGEFVLGVPYAKQTWAKGLDDGGRPVVLPNVSPSPEGTLVWPSLQGATNWFSPSYSPATKTLYVAVREMGSYYFKTDAEYKPGTFFAGGGERTLPRDQLWGAIRALDVATGSQRWEFKLHSPPWAGVLSTAGGVVFGGSAEGNFYALDASDGRPLWDFQTGGGIAANPISFSVDGRQYVLIAAGSCIFAFSLDASDQRSAVSYRGKN
jgi:alcohol dehydrogenase (cytochrome c)